MRNSVEMVNIIRSLEGCYDLILVGRRHESESPLYSGLTDWNEYPELGFLADMLVSSDSSFHGSVLVVQQQNRLGVVHHDLHLDSSFISKNETVIVADVDPNTRVWPVV